MRTAEQASSFVPAPGFFFTVAGAEAPSDAAPVGAGLNFKLNQNVSFYGMFDGESAGGERSLMGRGGLSILW